MRKIKLTYMTVTRLFSALSSNKLGILIPFVFFLLISTILFVIAEATAPIAPFIYSLF